MTNENEEIVTPTNKNETETTEEIIESEDEAETEADGAESEKDKKIKTLERQKEHWRKKAQDKKDSPKKESNSSELSTKDAITLMRADVHEEDIDEVVNYAKYRNISISEALKDSTMQTIIANRKEERDTAAATSVRKGKPTGAQKTDAQVLEEARTGNIPEKGTPEAEQMFNAQFGIK